MAGRMPALILVAASWTPAAVATAVMTWRGEFVGTQVCLVVAALAFGSTTGPVLHGDRSRRSGLVMVGAGVGAGWLALAAVFSSTEATASSSAAFATIAVVLVLALVPSIVLSAVTSPSVPTDRRWVRLVSRTQAGILGATLYGAVLLTGAAAGWSETITQGLAAGFLALALSTALRTVERGNMLLAKVPVADPSDLMAGLGDHFARAGGGAAGALDDLAEALRETWSLDSVVIVPVGAASPAERELLRSALRMDLRSENRVTGHLTATSADHDLLREHVEPMLRRVAGLIGVSVVLADLNSEIGEMRRQMLHVRTRERQLLHRELHGSLAPSLTEAAADLRRIPSLLGEDPPGAQGLVEHVRRRLAQCTSDVRTLARALLPSALDEGDLAAALGELTRRRGGARVEWRVSAERSDGLSAAAQLAVYLVVADLVAEAEASEADLEIDVEVVVSHDVARVRVTVPGSALPGPLRSRLRSAVERRAAELALSVHGLPAQQGIEVVVPQ